MNGFLTVEQAAPLLRMSRRTVYELTRARAIPHRRLCGRRRCLFLLDELTMWLDGAALEVLELEDGGRVVRPAYSRGTPGPHRPDDERGSR